MVVGEVTVQIFKDYVETTLMSMTMVVCVSKNVFVGSSSVNLNIFAERGPILANALISVKQTAKKLRCIWQLF